MTKLFDKALGKACRFSVVFWRLVLLWGWIFTCQAAWMALRVFFVAN
jgi:hypothetical protein